MPPDPIKKYVTGALVVVLYGLLALVAGVAAILWRIV